VNQADAVKAGNCEAFLLISLTLILRLSFGAVKENLSMAKSPGRLMLRRIRPPQLRHEVKVRKSLIALPC
jgi:hypothetical protein